MRQNKYFVSVALTLLLLIAYFAYGYFQGPLTQVQVVKSGNFVHTVVASGRVESPHRINISAQITGTVSRVPVQEGQQVDQNRMLIELENSELKSNLQQALASELQAQTNLRQLQELKAPVAVQALIQANVNLISAQNNAARSLDLFGKGFIGAAAKEESERLFQIAQAQVQSANHQLTSLQKGGSEISTAQASLQQAQANVQTARARLNYTQINAIRSGTLIARNVEPGDGVQPGKILMVLSPQGAMQLVVQIDEKNLKWLRLNQKAWASADAFSDKKFETQVSFINPSIDPQRGSVEVKLNVLNPPEELKQDMTVSVDIEVARRENATLVSLTAVHDFDKPNPWVLWVKQGRVQRQFVQLGLISQGFAEVVSGLHAGDQLLPTALAHVGEGSRLRTTMP